MDTNTNTNTKPVDDILRKIQALLDKADSTTFIEEAKTFRAKAEILMHKYRIEEAMLAKADPVGVDPVWRDINVTQANQEWTNHYYTLFVYCMKHLDVRHSLNIRDGNFTASCVGFESDLRFAEVLWTNVKMAFGSRLDPDYDPDAPDQLNAYRMRKAGWEGKRIALALYGSDAKNLRPKVRKLFAQEATARGEDPSVLLGRNVNVKTYRMSYADGFLSEFSMRLHVLRTERGEESTGLVLAGRKEAVDEAFYERYPNMRPMGKLPTDRSQAECPRCKAAKSGGCRQHPWNRRRVAPQGPKRNWDAVARGREAARSVDLGTKGRLT